VDQRVGDRLGGDGAGAGGAGGALNLVIWLFGYLVIDWVIFAVNSTIK
jgi:hypothetical protein